MAANSVLLCLLSALLSLSQAQNNNCKVAYYGDISGKSIPLQTAYLRPGRPEYELLIPDKCSNAGLLVRACHPDYQPQVTIVSTHDVKITLDPFIWIHHEIAVDVTVFCGTHHDPRLMYPPELFRSSV
ncbi:hypothetical protein evm_012435 [Chilo suppressalis]|nr:hypothetical protein evm_012435 [Chilo suppressalis]